MKKISLKTIAEEMGVSVATVSLVLSGKGKDGRIGKELNEKIVAFAKKHNYQPNNLARSLRSGKSNTIGLIVADISNVFFGKLAACIQEQAEKYGYTVIITSTNESDIKMSVMVNILKGRQVDGFIIVPTENGEKTIKKLQEEKFPFVLVDRYYPFLENNSVTTDSYSASLKAAKTFVESGCKRIAIITYKSKMSHMLARKSGFSDALEYSNLLDNSRIKEIRYSSIYEDIEEALDGLLNTDEPIDAIFLSTNSISLIALRSILSRGFRIPEDIKVICFDKSEAYFFMQNSVPYIQQPVEEIGEKSVKILLEQIHDIHKEPVNVCLQASFQHT